MERTDEAPASGKKLSAWRCRLSGLEHVALVVPGEKEGIAFLLLGEVVEQAGNTETISQRASVASARQSRLEATQRARVLGAGRVASLEKPRRNKLFTT